MKMRMLICLVSLLAIPGLVRAQQDSNLLVDNFDGSGPKIGMKWETHFDKNKLGTKVEPFSIEKGSAKSDDGHHGHFVGHLGRNIEPYPYAVVELPFASDGPKDLSAFKAIRFYAKGDGKSYRVGLGRTAVKDFCHYQFGFTAPKEWTLIVCPLDQFVQPDWGMPVEKGFKDVTSVRFELPAGTDDEDFDLRVDNVEFVTVLPAAK